MTLCLLTIHSHLHISHSTTLMLRAAKQTSKQFAQVKFEAADVTCV
jgi:hypothetical protein